jgi:aspartyl-tRNA(Asn)/glutamyl-tRNA(Gln) amidotransferase subunit C
VTRTNNPGRSLRRSDSIEIVSTSLSIDDVERIAALAHLDLSAAEKELFRKQLADVLAYAEQVQQIDTSGVPATAQVDSHAGHDRDDQARPSVPTGEMLANAPDADTDAGLFRVPRVIGG